MEGPRYFTVEEATNLIGKVFKSNREFWGVPSGTLCTVVEMYKTTPGRAGVMVHWHHANIKDGFTKWELEEFLVPVDKPEITPSGLAPSSTCGGDQECLGTGGTIPDSAA